MLWHQFPYSKGKPGGNCPLEMGKFYYLTYLMFNAYPGFPFQKMNINTILSKSSGNQTTKNPLQSLQDKESHYN